jgi:hypothetical protein
MENNTIDMYGNNNIVIQSCDFSTISVHSILNLDELKEKLDNLLNLHITPVNILVITSTSERLKLAYPDFDVSEIENRHGAAQKDWKPFVNEVEILNILAEYQKKSGFQIQAFILDLQQNVDNTLINRFKLRKKDTILIIDGLALYYSGNQEIARIFNENDIGGCLMLICKNYSSQIKQKIHLHSESVFHSLHDYYNQYAQIYVQERNNGFFHFDLQVEDKNHLFRRLTSIATSHLLNKPQRHYADLDKMNISDTPPLNNRKK